jgi:hypothetical protein
VTCDQFSLDLTVVSLVVSRPIEACVSSSVRNLAVSGESVRKKKTKGAARIVGAPSMSF